MARAHGTGPAHRGPKYHAKRDQILDVAVAAFRRKGYAGTSMQDISRALRLTKGSLYYYFRDKEDILFGCHDRALDHLLSIAREVRRRHPGPEEALRELIRQHVGIMVHEFRGTALALEVGALTGPRLRRVVSRRDEYEGVLRDIVEGGIRAGLFRPVDPKVTGFAILGAVNWIAKWYREEGPSAAEEVGQAFADLFLQGLVAGAGSPGRRRRETRRGA